MCHRSAQGWVSGLAGCRGSHDASGLRLVHLLFHSFDPAGTMATSGPPFRGKSSCRKSPRRVSDWSSLGHVPTLNWGMGNSGQALPTSTCGHRPPVWTLLSSRCVSAPAGPSPSLECGQRRSGHDCSVRAQMPRAEEQGGTLGSHKPGCESLLCSNRLCDVGKLLELSEPHVFLLTLSLHGEVLVCGSPGPGVEGELQ